VSLTTHTLTQCPVRLYSTQDPPRHSPLQKVNAHTPQGREVAGREVEGIVDGYREGAARNDSDHWVLSGH